MLDTQAEAAIRAAAEGYCLALHNADADFLDTLCHDRYFMTSKQPDGTELFFDKTAFVERCRARDPFAREPSFEILSIDIEPEMAHVKLWVDMAPRRYCDYLGFIKVGDDWKLITKLYRTAKGPAVGA